MRRSSRVAAGCLLVHSLASGAPPNYLEYVRKFGDTLLEIGLDRYGAKKTPLWAGVIDTQTLAAPQDNVPPPEGVRPSDRALGGANLYHDAVTLRVFRVLSALTGEPKYAAAARRYIDYYLRHAQNHTTGFLAWGEHLYYDFYRDEVAAERRSHELLEWTPPWPELWEVNPEAVSRAIQALRFHYYADDPAQLFNRHAWWDRAEHQKPGGQPWIKHSGLYAYSFMFLYKQTGERRWLAWSRGAGSLYWNRRNQETNLTLSCIDDPREGSKRVSSGTALLAYWLLKAHHLNPRETGIRNQAVALLKAYGRYTYDARRDGYLAEVNTDGARAGEDLIQPWNFAYGAPTILPFGRVAAYFARTEKDPAFLEMAHRVARIAKATPMPERVSIEGLGFALNLALDLFELTAEDRYLDEARSYADLAIRSFWVELPGGGLFVREPHDRYYEAKVGVGDLLAGLVRLQIQSDTSLLDLGVYDWSF
jgi:hypothetical protein